MKNLIVDSYLGGTGIRDMNEGGYIDPESLGLEPDLISKINNWLKEYNDEFFKQYGNKNLIQSLDDEGLKICKEISLILKDTKIIYFSDALMKTIR